MNWSVKRTEALVVIAPREIYMKNQIKTFSCIAISNQYMASCKIGDGAGCVSYSILTIELGPS